MADKRHRFTQDILRLLADGKEIPEIAKVLGCTPAAVRYHKLRIGVVPKIARYDWAEIQRLYDAGATRLALMRKFGFSEPAWVHARKKGHLTLPKNDPIPLGSFFQVGIKFDRGNMRRRLLNAGLLKNQCNRCGMSEWMGEQLNCQIHHKNGNNLDNRRDNLEMLCPNCHSITDTYAAKNSTAAIVRARRLGLTHPQMSRIEGMPKEELARRLKKYVKPKTPALGMLAPLNPLHERASIKV